MTAFFLLFIVSGKPILGAIIHIVGATIHDELDLETSWTTVFDQSRVASSEIRAKRRKNCWLFLIHKEASRLSTLRTRSKPCKSGRFVESEAKLSQENVIGESSQTLA